MRELAPGNQNRTAKSTSGGPAGVAGAALIWAVTYFTPEVAREIRTLEERIFDSSNNIRDWKETIANDIMIREVYVAERLAKVYEKEHKR